MVTMTVSEVRDRFAASIDRAKDSPVTVVRRGRPQVVLVAPEQYDRMAKAVEELADIVAFDQAMAEDGDNIPWEQALADLGWV